MSYPLENRTIREIKDKASRLKRLAANGAEFFAIEQAARKLLIGHFEWVGAYHINDLYRGRKWRCSELPTNVNQLLARPSTEIERYGRLNIPGQSILYVSEITQTVLNELRMEKGEFVVLLRLIKQNGSPSFYVSHLGMLPQNIELNLLSNREKDILDIVGGYDSYKKLIGIRKSISKLFRTIVDDKNSDFYKVTSALGHNHFRQDEIHGIMYPSVTTRYSTCNLAIKPSVVGPLYVPHSVAYMKIVETDWDFHHVDTLQTGWITEEGSIVWDDSLSFESPGVEGMEFTEMELSEN